MYLTYTFLFLLLISTVCLFGLFKSIEQFEKSSSLMNFIDPLYGGSGILIPVVRKGDSQQPEQPKQPEQPEQPEQPKKPEQPKQPEQPKLPEQPKQPEQPKEPEPPKPSGSTRLTLEQQVNKFFSDWPASEYEKTVQYLIDNGKPDQNGRKKCENTQIGKGNEDEEVRRNKAKLVKIMNEKKIQQTVQAFLLAFAMIETSQLSVVGRDTSKDGSGGSANYTLFNLNQSMILDVIKEKPNLKEKVGDIVSNPAASILNQDTDESISLAIDLVLDGIELWGLDAYISYLRGGGTLFRDKTDYRDKNCGGFLVKIFKVGFSKLADMIIKDPAYMTDGRRIAACIPWVGDGDMNSCG